MVWYAGVGCLVVGMYCGRGVFHQLDWTFNASTRLQAIMYTGARLMMRITLLYCVGAAQGNSAAQTAAIMPLLGEKIALPSTPNVSAVHTVHLVFSHHLDVGLNKALQFAQFCNGFATKIVQQYFDDFIPRAISIAKELNDDEDSFAYTLHPWIVSLYVDCVPWDVPDGCPLNPGKLRCPSKAQVGEFDDAVRRGHLLWADSPMNLDAGVVGEPGMFEALVDIAGALNERYNLTKTARVWSNVDVPGFVRSSIPPLRRANVTALSVCANDNGNGPIEFIGSSKDPTKRQKTPRCGGGTTLYLTRKSSCCTTKHRVTQRVTYPSPLQATLMADSPVLTILSSPLAAAWPLPAMSDPTTQAHRRVHAWLRTYTRRSERSSPMLRFSVRRGITSWPTSAKRRLQHCHDSPPSGATSG